MGNQKPIPESQPAQPPQPAKSNKALIIILIVILVLAVLGGGGYLGWRFVIKKMFQETPQATTSPTPAISQKLKDLEELFKYPDAEVTKSEKGTGDNESIDMEMETFDSVAKVYNHYMILASDKKWGLGSRGYSTGGGSAWMRIEEKDFQVHLDLTQNTNSGKVTIAVSIELGQFEASTDYDYDISASGETSSAAKSGTMPTNSYVISDSDTRLISQSELTNLTPWQLKVARNEIYARHGRAFVHKDLQCYFAKQSWYQVDPSYSDSILSAIENKNIATILNYEEKINSSLLRVDSGC